MLYKNNVLATEYISSGTYSHSSVTQRACVMVVYERRKQLILSLYNDSHLQSQNYYKFPLRVVDRAIYCCCFQEMNVSILAQETLISLL